MTEDAKDCCNQSKAISRTHHGDITKLTKKVNKLLSKTTILEDLQT